MSQGKKKKPLFFFLNYMLKNNNYLFKNSWQFIVHNYVIMWIFFFTFTFSFYYLSFLRFIINLYFCYSFYGEKINQNMSVKFDLLILHKNLMEYVWKQFKFIFFHYFLIHLCVPCHASFLCSLEQSFDVGNLVWG